MSGMNFVTYINRLADRACFLLPPSFTPHPLPHNHTGHSEGAQDSISPIFKRDSGDGDARAPQAHCGVLETTLQY